MAKQRHLPNAPIVEAMIDFRVKPRSGFVAAEFDRLKPILAEEFPHVSERRGFELSGDSRQLQSTVMRDLGLQGLFFQSPDRKFVAQCRVDGLTLNRLKPYTSWDELFPIAVRLWKTYAEVAKPDALVRLALRYLNRIPLPQTMSSFEQFLTAPPPVPQALPQLVSHFVSRVTVHDPDNELSAHISQVLEPDALARRVSVLLDIDAYREKEYAADDPGALVALEKLHEFKNRIFFNLVTDETVRMFE